MKTGVVRRPWHTREVKAVYEWAGKKSVKEISEMVDRTPGALAQWAHERGISLAVKGLYTRRKETRKLYRHWKEWELNVVELTILNDQSSLSVESLLARHSKCAIVQRFSITRKKMRESSYEK